MRELKKASACLVPCTTRGRNESFYSLNEIEIEEDLHALTMGVRRCYALMTVLSDGGKFIESAVGWRFNAGRPKAFDRAGGRKSVMNICVCAFRSNRSRAKSLPDFCRVWTKNVLLFLCARELSNLSVKAY